MLAAPLRFSIGVDVIHGFSHSMVLSLNRVHIFAVDRGRFVGAIGGRRLPVFIAGTADQRRENARSNQGKKEVFHSTVDKCSAHAS